MKHILVSIMGNIDDETFRWIVGGLVGVIISVGSFWLSHLTAKVDLVVHDVSERNQRISALEANVDTVSKRLDRIESKLDYLIQGSVKK